MLGSLMIFIFFLNFYFLQKSNIFKLTKSLPYTLMNYTIQMPKLRMIHLSLNFSFLLNLIFKI